jgi:uncharacterized RDD family membrane protein YckC
MTWYYVESNQQRGPFSDADFQNLVRGGTIGPDTLVWREGMAEWQPYRIVASSGYTPGAPGTGTVVCAECGRTFPPEEVVRIGHAQVCAGCKPVAVQRLQEGVLARPGLEYGSFWLRAAAKIIDYVIMVAVFLPIYLWIFPAIFGDVADPEIDLVRYAAWQVGLQFVSTALWGVYTILFLGKYGATPGKMVCRLVVVTSDGGKISYARAAGRFFAEILSALICYIGYLLAVFDEEKRTLHDRICDTRVVRQ